ncbi:MAG TPA: GNAT family N-acetyltransferase [Thermoanaerobaculia bacterium]
MARELARTLPDLPRWVETRGMLLAGRCNVYKGPRGKDGYAIRGTHEPLVCIVGSPRAETIRSAVEDLVPDLRVLVPLDSRDLVAAALPGWMATTATIHRLGEGGLAPDSTFAPGDILTSVEIRLLRPEEAEGVLARLPAGLRDEIAWGMSRSPMATAFVDGEPAAFCYASWETEGLWDISIDTLEPFRRRGLAERCIRFLSPQMTERGKQAVWGAEDWNIPSLRLAAKLGFVPVDRLVLFSPPG